MTSEQKWKILVVDDNLLVMRIYTIFLQKLGHEIITAYDDNMAIDACKNNKIDFIFMDVSMSRGNNPNLMDGLEATLRIRAIEKYNVRVPIIIISGFSMTTHSMAIESGADEYLRKPVRSVNFTTVIDKYRKRIAENDYWENLFNLGNLVKDHVNRWIDSPITCDGRLGISVRLGMRKLKIYGTWEPPTNPHVSWVGHDKQVESLYPPRNHL